MLSLTLATFLLTTPFLLMCRTEGRSEESRETFLMLDGNGRPQDSSKIPKCDQHEHINLILYNYQQRECHYVCNSSHIEPLRDKEQLLLHEMCSMQDTCRNLSFPLRSNQQKQKTNSVFLKFQCLDDANNGFVYFCEQRTMTFSQPIYLAWNSTSGYFDTCKCNVNYGMFYITVTDLRLKVKLKNKCSSTILQIISTNYICDSQSATFGSVFNRQIDGLTTDAYISITTRFEDVSPDMVVVKLKPKASARLYCTGSTRKFTQHQIESTSPKDERPQDQRGTSDTKSSNADIIIPVWVSCIISLIILIVILIFWIRHERGKHCCRVISKQQNAESEDPNTVVDGKNEPSKKQHQQQNARTCKASTFITQPNTFPDGMSELSDLQQPQREPLLSVEVEVTPISQQLSK